MAIDKESLKKMFPNLYRELEEGEAKIPINAVRKNPEQAEAENAADAEVENAQEIGVETEAEECEPKTRAPDKLRHFNPSAVDFIRRCDTEAQAEEIIAYLQRKGEVTKKHAKELLCQLKRDGLRSFGPKKEENHYFREGGIF
jgi:hypothetical protein